SAEKGLRRTRTNCGRELRNRRSQVRILSGAPTKSLLYTGCSRGRSVKKRASSKELCYVGATRMSCPPGRNLKDSELRMAGRIGAVVRTRGIGVAGMIIARLFFGGGGARASTTRDNS